MRLPAAVILTLSLLLGCSRDPEAQKAQFLNRGNEYFQQGKYREAGLEYLNAIQIDQRYAEAHYRLAQTYRQREFATGAYQELTTVLALQPDNLPAQIELGNLLLSAREFTKAQERAEAVLARDPNNVDAHILLANAHAGINNFEQSLHEMQTAIQLAPDRPSSYLNMAYLQLDANHAAASETNFLKAVSLDSQSITARVALGNFYRQEKRWAEAEQQFRQAIQIDPRQPAIYGALAALLNDRDQRAAAEQILAQAKGAMPELSAGYRLLGDFYFFTGDRERALQEYGALLQQHPRDQRVAQNYIKLLVLGNRPEEAAALNDKFLKEHGQDVDSLILRGEILGAQKRWDAAMVSFETAIKLDPNNAVAHYGLGVVLISMDSAARGTGELQQAARLQPGMTEAYQALGAQALRSGDLAAAAGLFEEALRKNPRDVPALKGMAQINNESYLLMEHGGDLNLALSLAQAARRAMPHLANTADTLGWAHFNKGNYDLSVDLLRDAVKTSPADPTYRYHLGMAYQKKRDPAGARKQFERALQLNPQPPQAAQIRKALAETAGNLSSRRLNAEPLP